MRTVFSGAFLLLGVASVGVGCARWRAGGKQRALSGTMLVALAVSMLTVGWVRYAAWAVLAAFSVVVIGKRFTDRDPLTLWIGLVFLPIIFGVALMEVLSDDLSVMQKAAFSAVAVLAAAAIVTAIVRLVQASRRRHA